MKKIRNLELRRAHERLVMLSEVIPSYAAAGRFADEFNARITGKHTDEPVPFLGYTAALNAANDIAGMAGFDTSKPLPVADTLTIVESWLIHRWLRTPVLYRPHPALYRALRESDPPHAVDPRVLQRLHGQTWAILVPESEAHPYPYRFLIGGISAAALSGARGDITAAISTCALAPSASGFEDPRKGMDFSEGSIVTFSDADRIREVYEGGDDEQKTMQRITINAGLYLASAAPDIQADWEPKSRKSAIQAQKRPRMVQIGESIGPRLGAVLNMQAEPQPRGDAKGGTHASPVTHYRRGHWRMVWRGSRKDGQPGTHQLPKWIEPCVVGEGAPLPVQRPLR